MKDEPPSPIHTSPFLDSHLLQHSVSKSQSAPEQGEGNRTSVVCGSTATHKKMVAKAVESLQQRKRPFVDPQLVNAGGRGRSGSGRQRTGEGRIELQSARPPEQQSPPRVHSSRPSSRYGWRAPCEEGEMCDG